MCYFIHIRQMHIDEVKSSKCKYFFMHQVREMHTFDSSGYDMRIQDHFLRNHFLKTLYCFFFFLKSHRPFHEETQ